MDDGLQTTNRRLTARAVGVLRGPPRRRRARPSGPAASRPHGWPWTPPAARRRPDPPSAPAGAARSDARRGRRRSPRRPAGPVDGQEGVQQFIERLDDRRLVEQRGPAATAGDVIAPSCGPPRSPGQRPARSLSHRPPFDVPRARHARLGCRMPVRGPLTPPVPVAAADRLVGTGQQPAKCGGCGTGAGRRWPSVVRGAGVVRGRVAPRAPGPGTPETRRTLPRRRRRGRGLPAG